MSVVARYEESPGPGSAVGVLVGTVVSPFETFGAIRPASGVWPALVFAVVLLWIGSGLELLSMQSDLARLAQQYPDLARQMGEAIRTAAAKAGLTQWLTLLGDASWSSIGLVWLASFPLVALGFLFTVVGVHVCLFLVGAAGGGLGSTLRVIAYSSGNSLVAQVPWVGGVASLVLVSIQQLTGLGCVHKTTYGRVAMGLCVPLIAAGCALLGIVAWVLHGIH